MTAPRSAGDALREMHLSDENVCVPSDLAAIIARVLDAADAMRESLECGDRASGTETHYCASCDNMVDRNSTRREAYDAAVRDLMRALEGGE